MIMIIAIIYIFLPDMIFDQQLKITLGKSSAPLKKPTPPFLLTSLKIQKLQVPPLFAKIEIFLAQPPTLQKEGGRTLQDFWCKKFP